MASTMSSKRATIVPEKRIDNHTQSYPTLDYSFHNAQSLEGRMLHIACNYITFRVRFVHRLMSIDAVAMEPRVTSMTQKLFKEGDQYRTHAINFNHNMLNGSLITLSTVVQSILVDPNLLTSLDLSFNVFTEIPTVN
jgi:hypothetical protein